MDIQSIINKFNREGRFSASQTYTENDLERFESNTGIQFPEDFKKVHLSGSFYKCNFHFIEPRLIMKNPELVSFARWNETLFAFGPKEEDSNDFPVYMLVGEFVEKKFKNFCEWFHMVYEATREPSKPE
jgi:hypothetical protein